jgi:hypothetical protein
MSSRQGCNPSGESPAASVTRDGRVGIPHPGMAIVVVSVVLQTQLGRENSDDVAGDQLSVWLTFVSGLSAFLRASRVAANKGLPPGADVPDRARGNDAMACECATSRHHGGRSRSVTGGFGWTEPMFLDLQINSFANGTWTNCASTSQILAERKSNKSSCSRICEYIML